VNLLEDATKVHCNLLGRVHLEFRDIAGVMVSDYYLVRKGFLDIQALYSAERDGIYYGTFGVVDVHGANGNINPNSTSKANNVDQDAGYVGSITG
jgi:purine-cytosine permease-like protein